MIQNGTDELKSVTAYLGLGANLGDREASLRVVLGELDALPTITITAVSSLYETTPVGVTDQPHFLNAVAQIQTTLHSLSLLQTVLHLENQHGRVRTERWGPRVIDIDILVYGNERIALPGLTVPHPRLTERAFVLIPLAEIAPDLVLPGLASPVKKLAEEFRQTGNIQDVRIVKEVRR